ncbi:class I SAM-dependent methyltransferase [Inquilinus sp.]|jgi:SAM-dependent methyltransferase|uniref:class I SAM-dependent methyltransferase n=1 Tax=Inquilinus sp. TaxID=1932117 RepID=UPI003785271E
MDRLYDDPDLVSFYDVENVWSSDQDYCRSLAAGCASVLDLGCGTGWLAAELASGRAVVGVDPAEAMLEIARARPGGDRVTWVRGDGRSVRLDRRFDLIVLTGHAFQVFLTPADRLAALRTIAAHLAPEGRFIFDSRNPAREEWREWTPAESARRIEHPRFGPVDAWNDVEHDPATGIVTYGTIYRIAADGRVLCCPRTPASPSRRATSSSG